MYTPLDIPLDSSKPFTDYTRWRLKSDDGGRHIWHYLPENEVAAWPQTDIDKYSTGVSIVSFCSIHGFVLTFGRVKDAPTLPPAKDALSAARNGYKFYKRLQSTDGHWSGEYGGPMFLMPGLVIGSYVTGMEFEEAQRLEMVRYLMNHTHEDGGWGL